MLRKDFRGQRLVLIKDRVSIEVQKGEEVKQKLLDKGSLILMISKVSTTFDNKDT